MRQNAAMPEQSPFARLAITHALAIGADTLVAVALRAGGGGD